MFFGGQLGPRISKPLRSVNKTFYRGFGPTSGYRRGLESPLLSPETHSAFHPHAQRNAFRRRDAQRVESAEPIQPPVT
jgi:hypothetical protein